MKPADISIIIPAYNESLRLPIFLKSIAAYLGNSPLNAEVIVVDDGSTDGTAEIAEKFPLPAGHDMRVLRMPQNAGKGGAVKAGMLAAAGNVVLFMDADGSVQPDEIGRNLKYISMDHYDIFIGSRVLKGDAQVLETKMHRRIMGSVFNTLVKTILGGDTMDTQCGFKMFRREAVGPVFSQVSLKGFGFDMEVLYLAKKMGLRIKEAPVSWKSVDGSKVNLISDPLFMLVNLFQIRWRHGR